MKGLYTERPFHCAHDSGFASSQKPLNETKTRHHSPHIMIATTLKAPPIPARPRRKRREQDPFTEERIDGSDQFPKFEYDRSKREDPWPLLPCSTKQTNPQTPTHSKDLLGKSPRVSIVALRPVQWLRGHSRIKARGNTTAAGSTRLVTGA
jgi:hypothetical protein